MIEIPEISKILKGKIINKIESKADKNIQTGEMEYLQYDLFCDDGTIINLLPYIKYGNLDDGKTICSLEFNEWILHAKKT
jgi:hypothetical protein